MAGWHHWLNGRESGWTPGVGDGQGGLACCDSWGCRESDMTEWLNWTELSVSLSRMWESHEVALILFSFSSFLILNPLNELIITHKVSKGHSVISDSLRPHGLYSPGNSLGQNTGVGTLSLLQGIFPTQESNPGLPQCSWILYQLSHREAKEYWIG